MNRSAADQLYQEALLAYAGAPMDQFLYLSAYPFGNSNEVGEMPVYSYYEIPQGYTPSPALERLFVQRLLLRAQKALESPSEEGSDNRLSDSAQMWLAFTRLERQIQESLPDLYDAAQQAKATAFALQPQKSQQRVSEIIEIENVPQKSFDEQLEEVERFPRLHDQRLVFALAGAPVTESIDRLLRVAAKIDDSAVRDQLVNWNFFSRAQEAIRGKKLDEARNLAAKVVELDQRAYLYSRIAEESLKQAPEQTQARELLEEVATAVARAPSTIVTARALLGLAYLYTKIDINRALELVGDAVKCINRLEAPDFSREDVTMRIEGKSFGIYRDFQTPGFNPENGFRELGRVAFDNALYQASNFSDKSLRALTTLTLIEPCLLQSPNLPSLRKKN